MLTLGCLERPYNQRNRLEDSALLQVSFHLPLPLRLYNSSVSLMTDFNLSQTSVLCCCWVFFFVCVCASGNREQGLMHVRQVLSG